MENHHFSWEHRLFLWSFSIAIHLPLLAAFMNLATARRASGHRRRFFEEIWCYLVDPSTAVGRGALKKGS
jgi:hypothetical protein